MLKSKLLNGKKKKSPKRFYCRRCERNLLSKICPIHGIEWTVVLEPSNHKSLLPPKQTPQTDKRFSYPRHIATETSAASPKNQGNNTLPTDRAFNPDTDFYTTYLADHVMPVEGEQPEEIEQFIADDVHQAFEKAPSPLLPEEDLPETPVQTLFENNTEAAQAEQSSETPQPPPKTELPITAIELPPSQTEPQNAKTEPENTGEISLPEMPANEKPPKGRHPWLLTGGTFRLLIAGCVTFFSFSYSGFDRSSQMEAAEAFFIAAQYDAALQAFQQYKQNYPQDAAALVDQRIEAIKSIKQALDEKHARVQQLMENATLAFNQQRYMLPEGDNTITYISELLALEPGFPAAKELQDRVVEHYIVLAEKAFETDHYKETLTYYRNVLSVRPDDAAVATEINRTLELQKLDEKLKKLNMLAAQQSTIRKLRREKAQLKKQIQEERLRLKEIARQREDAEAELIAKLAEVKEVNASLAAQRGNLDLSIDLSAANDNEIFDVIALDAKVVEETLVDGGKKKYIYKEKPKLPPEVNPKEMTMILAECVVDVDGNVEQVELLSVADDDQINTIALNSFKKFRFRPATYNGSPVKFKSLEVIAF